MGEVIGFRDYDLLPEVIRANVTKKEYAWMTDDQKAELTDSFTEPDVLEDGPSE